MNHRLSPLETTFPEAAGVGELRDLAAWRDPADSICRRPEPHAAIRAGNEPGGVEGKGKLRDGSGRRNAADVASVRLGEPDVTVRSRGNALQARGRGRNREVGDVSGCRDSTDPVGVVLREPEASVGSRGESIGPGEGDRTVERNSVRVPSGVIRPIWLRLFASMNQMLPSDPDAMPAPPANARRAKVVTAPLASTRPSAFSPASENHMAPSDPATIPTGWLYQSVNENVVTV